MVICIMVSYLYSYEKIGTSLNIPYVKIQETSSLFLKEGEQILIASPGGGDCEKLKKGIEVWCRGRSSEKKGGGGAGPFLCNFLKVYHFYISDAFYFYFWILVK